jgi:hypothetical protein
MQRTGIRKRMASHTLRIEEWAGNEESVPSPDKESLCTKGFHEDVALRAFHKS